MLNKLLYIPFYFPFIYNFIFYVKFIKNAKEYFIMFFNAAVPPVPNTLPQTNGALPQEDPSLDRAYVNPTSALCGLSH
jgi:hypothetical protein